MSKRHNSPRRLPATAHAVLGLLSIAREVGRPLSGYELKKWAENLRFFWSAPAQSQIYAELRRLDALGMVTAREVEQRGRPDKVVYEITEAGREELTRWLEEDPVTPPTLRHPVALRVFFGHATTPRRLELVLAAYAAELEEVLVQLQEIREDLGDAAGFRYPALVAEWGLSYFAAEQKAVARLRARLTPSPTPQRG